MRILIVTQYFWPESFLVNDLAVELRKRGHEMTVLTGVPNYPQGTYYEGYGPFSPKEEDIDGVRTLRVPVVSRGKSRGARLAMNYLSFALSASCLGPYRCRRQYDVVLAFQTSPATVGLPAMVLKRWCRAPLVMWVQDLWPDSLSAAGAVTSPWILNQVDRMVRSIYRACDRVLVQSRGFIEHVAARGVSVDRIDYLPNWASACYQPVALEKDASERRAFPAGFNLLFAGNLGVSQSLSTLLGAAELTRDCSGLRWTVIGEGREKAWLADEIEKRGLADSVTLLPGAPSSAMPRFFAAADALLVCLKRGGIYALTIPSKVQSYMACGRPILASIDGEGARIIEDAQAGVVCPAEDAPALAAGARRLQSLAAANREALGAAGLEYAQRHFRCDLLIDRLESILGELTGVSLCAA